MLPLKKIQPIKLSFACNNRSLGVLEENIIQSVVIYVRVIYKQGVKQYRRRNLLEKYSVAVFS